MTAPLRLVASEENAELTEISLRPQRLEEFVGQAQARKNLRVFIEAAKTRREAMDHVLFYGPPGLGKTTLSQIMARELGVGFRSTSGPVIARAGDLAALLTNLQPYDVLFIDEIHRLNPAVEEILYPAMEDYKLGSYDWRRALPLGPFKLIFLPSPLLGLQPVQASFHPPCGIGLAFRCVSSSIPLRNFRTFF